MTHHTTVGVYSNLEYKINGVEPDHLEGHVEYNKSMRFGRALLVDGKVVYRGYFAEEDIPMLEEKFGHLRASKVSDKYW